MPPEIHHLYTHGHLTPAEAVALGAVPMGCANCREPVTLVTTFDPIPESEQGKGALPGLVWGETVLVMCPRCSFKQLTQTVGA
jgi:hypothetical protein